MWLREETAILPLRGSSLSVDRRRNDNSLSLRGSSRKQRRSYLSLGCCRRGRKSLIISLTVGILDGEEPLSLSLSLWINWNRKVRLFLLVALVDGDIWLSVDGSPQRRRCSLSMALRDSFRFCDELKGGQGSVSVSASQDPFVGSQQEPIHCDKLPAERRERKTWSPSEDIVLISSWLNTSKDPVVGNEQKSMAFWKRIAAYYLKKISR
uniref:Myb-like domain-containing protein n=1 Tax=Brassica oleracea var. oleracea TaxID=109376 RepID=A0A0D3ECE3_BRAOL